MREDDLENVGWDGAEPGACLDDGECDWDDGWWVHCGGFAGLVEGVGVGVARRGLLCKSDRTTGAEIGVAWFFLIASIRWNSCAIRTRYTICHPESP